MHFLFCCEFYHPSVGGVQVVMQQIAERLVAYGHRVTVATSRLAVRQSNVINGVEIAEFDVVGNSVRGMQGDLQAYRDFARQFDGDAILIKAAQQWTFDALWPVLHEIRARKVFIPCGFSNLLNPEYTDYFKCMPDVLRAFDHLIFYANEARDINFARAHGIQHFSIVPNGACEREFSEKLDPSFRARHGIPEDSFLFLTVGTMTGEKGHLEVLKAFAALNTHGAHASLFLNGNAPTPSKIAAVDLRWRARWKAFRRKVRGGAKAALRSGFNRAILALGLPSYWRRTVDPLQQLAWQIEGRQPNKLLLQTDLPRRELLQAFMQADLFVFASRIEYSPLVLFESAAAGTPFLSVPVGNAREIAEWTGAGLICESESDRVGYQRVDPMKLAQACERAMADPDNLRKMGEAGRQRCLQYFTWGVIARQYEAILSGKMTEIVPHCGT